MKIGDLVRFSTPSVTDRGMCVRSVGVVLPPTEGMSRYWANTTDDEMVNVFWSHLTGLMPYHKEYIEVIK